MADKIDINTVHYEAEAKEEAQMQQPDYLEYAKYLTNSNCQDEIKLSDDFAQNLSKFIKWYWRSNPCGTAIWDRSKLLSIEPTLIGDVRWNHLALNGAGLKVGEFEKNEIEKMFDLDVI